MEYAVWALIIGSLLIFMAIANSIVQRLPLSTSMIYLAVGIAMGPAGLNILRPDLAAHGSLLERIAEIALLISLLSAGLKLRQPLRNSRWRISVRLATVTVLVSIALLTPFIMLCGLPFSIALLIAVIIAPTDPVLAADVQIENVADRDLLRFSLTGESSLNDGTAFPFVALALLFIQRELALPHEPAAGMPALSDAMLHWFAVDYIWNIACGILIGILCGSLIGRVVLHLRTVRKLAIGLDEFLVLGLISLVYGVAILSHASPFLAVFCAGLIIDHTDEETTAPLPARELDQFTELASDPTHAAPLMMRALRGFNEQLERIAEVVIVILTGALLAEATLTFAAVAVAIFTLFIVRPCAVGCALVRARVSRAQHRLMSWFGIRGIGSIYYVLFALNHGLPAAWWNAVLSIAIVTVSASIVLHGISVTPLMNYYRRKNNPSLT
jgi:NhaP-type Na+/H+ or K+/H+ antiporter